MNTLDKLKVDLAGIYTDNIPIKDLELEIKLNGVIVSNDTTSLLLDLIVQKEVDKYKKEITQMLLDKLNRSWEIIKKYAILTIIIFLMLVGMREKFKTDDKFNKADKIISFKYSKDFENWLQQGKEKGITQYVDDPNTDDKDNYIVLDYKITSWNEIQVAVKEVQK